VSGRTEQVAEVLLQRVDIAVEVSLNILGAELIDLIATAGRNRRPVLCTGKRVTHAQNSPLARGYIPVQYPVFIHLAGEIDDFVVGYLRESGRGRRRDNIVYVHQAAEGAFVLPSIHASIGVKDRFGECERRSWDDRRSMDHSCRSEACTIKFDAKEPCRDSRKGKGANGGPVITLWAGQVDDRPESDAILTC
jgi:hypothetical protein